MVESSCIWLVKHIPFYKHSSSSLTNPVLSNSIFPALAFSLDMFANTNSSFGVNEVLLASVLGAVVFSLFSCQPLVIVGVTGESFTASDEIGHY